MSSSCCSCGSVGEGRRPRRNGWDCPWHPQQILAWSLIVFFAAMYFGFYVFYVPLCWRPAAITLPLVVMVILVVCLLVASSINPGDDNVRRKFQQLSQRPIPQFDRSRHQHVIEDYKCHLCECTVGPRAKHCRLCNKCISDFDHHCKWLNNCVGGRNYRWFMGALSSALLSTTTLSVMSFVFFVLFFAARSSVCYLDCGSISVCSSHFHYVNGTGNVTLGTSSANYTLDTRIHILSHPVPEEVFPVVAAVNLCLTIVATFLLCQLLLFHLYLFYRGMSTYDYITRKRESAPDRGISCCYGNQCQHHNKVKPSNGSFVGSESLSERSKTGESAHGPSGDNPPMQKEDISHSLPLEEVIPHSPTLGEDISYSPTQGEDILHIPTQEENISHSLPLVNSQYTSVVISNSLINNNRQTLLTPGQETIQTSEVMKEEHHQLSSEHSCPHAVLLDTSQTAYSDSRC